MIISLAQFRGRVTYATTIGWAVAEPLRYAGSRLPFYSMEPGTWPDVMHNFGGTNRFDTIHWGFRPAWAVEKDLPEQAGAPIENILAKPYYQGMMDTGRVIVPVDGWHELEGEGKQAVRWRVTSHEDSPMLLAAVARWEVYGHQPPGAGFTLALQDSHPVVLTPENALKWLDPRVAVEEAARIVQQRVVPPSELNRLQR